MARLREFFASMFGADRPDQEIFDVEQTPAFRILRRYNRNAIIGTERGIVCAIEDHADPDGRIFRIEYQGTPDGQHANAWVRHNPWGSISDMHTINNGMICIGRGAHDANPRRSQYDLETVIKKARYWCTAISVYHETGDFPSP